MNRTAAPSLNGWRSLYRAAAEFYSLAPWEWMYDRDIFGVKDSASGEIGYCCVMGNRREHFALGVYLGPAGLAGYWSIQTGEVTGIEALLTQRCLMASFEDREMVGAQDWAVIRQLGLSFRGRHAWPLFRSYEPRQFPWLVNKDEAAFLTIALQQSSQVASAFKEDKNYLDSPDDPDKLLVRQPDKGGRWHNTWYKPDLTGAQAPEEIEPEELPAEQLALLNRQRKSPAVFEIDVFPAGDMVVDHRGERPYYPFIMIVADRASYFVIGVKLAKYEELLHKFPANLYEILRAAPLGMPSRIAVASDQVRRAAEPLTAKLGMAVEITPHLRAIASARKAMDNFRI